jgi:hypothetical protein
MNAGELKKKLEKYPDDYEVFYNLRGIFLGNVGEIWAVKESTYGFFGESLPCILLENDLLDELESENADLRLSLDDIIDFVSNLYPHLEDEMRHRVRLIFADEDKQE